MKSTMGCMLDLNNEHGGVSSHGFQTCLIYSQQKDNWLRIAILISSIKKNINVYLTQLEVDILHLVKVP